MLRKVCRGFPQPETLKTEEHLLVFALSTQNLDALKYVAVANGAYGWTKQIIWLLKSLQQLLL
jgi:hypothetical protein